MTKTIATIDIGVACSPSQSPMWWPGIMNLLLDAQKSGIEIRSILAASSAVPDHNKNRLTSSDKDSDIQPYAPSDTPDGAIAPIGEKRRNSLTDANRSSAAKSFLTSTSDWMFWIDDDTVPPVGSILKLLQLHRSIVGGVYFLGGPPHNAVAYYQLKDGTYAGLGDYPEGTLVPVDSIGMGCTLIHRSAYEDIMNAYTVLQRPNGSLVPVKKENIFSLNGKEPPKESYVESGVLHMPLVERTSEDKRPWPFYALEYGRTEDHHFCELARSVGHTPYLDTTIICDHWKMLAINNRTRVNYLKKERAAKSD